MKRRRWWTKILIALFLAFLMAEISTRTYYLWIDEPFAADDTEYCLKKAWRDGVTLPDHLVNDPLIGWTLKPNYTNDQIIIVNGTRRLVYGSHHHNSKGMNNAEEFSLKKPENTTRIVMLGDSYTCGPDTPILLSMGNLLKEMIPHNEVLNFCVPERGIETMYARYVLEARNYSPDIVVWNINMQTLLTPNDCLLNIPQLEVIQNTIHIKERTYPSTDDFLSRYRPPFAESALVKHVLRWLHTVRREEKIQLGIKLLDTMMDNVRQDHTTLVVAMIPTQDALFADTFNDIKQRLFDKRINFLGQKYFQANKNYYRNQSWFLGNSPQYSVIGHGVHAGGIKMLLEHSRTIPPTTNYFFTASDQHNYMILVPDQFPYDTNVRVLYPYNTSVTA